MSSVLQKVLITNHEVGKSFFANVSPEYLAQLAKNPKITFKFWTEQDETNYKKQLLDQKPCGCGK